MKTKYGNPIHKFIVPRESYGKYITHLTPSLSKPVHRVKWWMVIY